MITPKTATSVRFCSRRVLMVLLAAIITLGSTPILFGQSHTFEAQNGYQFQAQSNYSQPASQYSQAQPRSGVSVTSQFQHSQPQGTGFAPAEEYAFQESNQEAAFQQRSGEPQYTKLMFGVDEHSKRGLGVEPKWHNSRPIPWENYSYGEYIGPARTPHVPTYRLRVNDQIEFVFQISRDNFGHGYRLSPGDVVRVTAPVDEKLNQATRLDGIVVMPDGTISLDLLGSVAAAGKTIQQLKAELDISYAAFYNSAPKVNVTGVTIGTKLRDFLDSVDARAGSGGQARQVSVAPDGTIRLPLIGTVGVVGLSLDELEREINMRFALELQGIRVTPILTQRAPRFIYVSGEVNTPGRFELTGPTSALQAIALAGGWDVGGNIRQIVVFRRDKDWKLMAIKLDLAGGLFGRRPAPSDEIWLRDSDIVLVPKKPIQRLADAIELYFSRTLYGIFPSEFGVFDAQSIGGQR